MEDGKEDEPSGTAPSTVASSSSTSQNACTDCSAPSQQPSKDTQKSPAEEKSNPPATSKTEEKKQKLMVRYDCGDEIIKIEKIGEGSFGIVYKSVMKKLGTREREPCALKKFKVDHSETEEDGEKFCCFKEIGFLGQELNHPNIIRFDRVYMGPDRKIFAKMDLGQSNLTVHLKKRLKEEQCRNIFKQILLGTKHFHDRRIIHCDLKPENVIVFPDDLVRISDFGMARKLFSVEPEPSCQVISTLWYRAPELVLGETRYAFEIDCWALGAILGALLKGDHLFKEGRQAIDHLFNVFRLMGTANEDNWPGVSKLPHYKPEFPKWKKANVSEKLGIKDYWAADLLEKLLECNPKKRFTVDQALAHPYLLEPDRRPPVPQPHPPSPVDPKYKTPVKMDTAAPKTLNPDLLVPDDNTKFLALMKELIPIQLSQNQEATLVQLRGEAKTVDQFISLYQENSTHCLPPLSFSFIERNSLKPYFSCEQ